MKNIKEARIKKGISQTAIANEIGLSQPGYANIENGETKNVPLLVAVKISKVLGIGFNELYDIDGDSQKIDGLNKEIETLKKRIVELEEQLADRKHLLEYIKNDDVLLSIAQAINHKIEGYNPVKRDFSDLDSLLKELEESPFDPGSRKSVLAFVMKHIDILQYNPEPL